MAAKAPSDQVQRVVSLALDAAFYRSVYADVGADVVGHYSRAGWREGRDPAPWFSTRAYLAANTDVASSRAEPLHHYLTIGRYEGREVYASEHAEAYFAQARAAGETPAWSFEALLAPLAEGEPATPTPSTPPNPTQAAAEPPAVAPTQEADASLNERALAAGAFDAAFYLGANPDVADAGMDPLTHFLVTGWRERRDPSRDFSVRDYLEANPDVAGAGMNPFVHYLRTGRAEGRAPRHDLGFRYEILSGLSPVEQRVERARAQTAEVNPGTAAALAAALAKSRTGLRRLHLTFSHDDYSANLGGVQLCLQREAAAFAELGWDHLHLHPAAFWPVVRQGEPGVLGVVWNGKSVGVFGPKTVAEVLRKTDASPERRSFAIHSLLGHDPDETVKILGAAGVKRGFFWLHDFASLCAGFHLLRDDVEDCAAPAPESAACGICIYGPWRARHLAAHGRLFKALELTVVSPSESALSLWRGAWSFPAAGEVVLPHAELVARGPAPLGGKGPFRLAFAGMPAAHKGWPVFRDLALRFAGDRRYQFIHLGGRGEGSLPVRFEPVSVTTDSPAAMQAAIEAARADAVLVWPLCRETFSFTTFEAVAAGAAVITNPDSGNVAAFVDASGHGRVLADEAALAALFETGEIRALSRNRRKPQVYDLAFSGMTAALLDEAPRP